MSLSFPLYVCSLNTLRLWQPQLFTTIENFDSLDTNVTNPTFCEILDISTAITNANKPAALEGMTNCEKVRHFFSINILEFVVTHYFRLQLTEN